MLVSKEDLNNLKELGISLKLDFVLNHLSVLSNQFQDIIKNGNKSEFKDFFVDWNKFWDSYGELTPEGYIQPKAEYIDKMFFRKPGLPILNIRMPNGKEVPYWNTFYQEIDCCQTRRSCKGSPWKEKYVLSGKCYILQCSGRK